MRITLSLLVGLWLCVDCGVASSAASSAAAGEEGTSVNLHLKLSEQAEAAAIEVRCQVGGEYVGHIWCRSGIGVVGCNASCKCARRGQEAAVGARVCDSPLPPPPPPPPHTVHPTR